MAARARSWRHDRLDSGIDDALFRLTEFRLTEFRLTEFRLTEFKWFGLVRVGAAFAKRGKGMRIAAAPARHVRRPARNATLMDGAVLPAQADYQARYGAPVHPGRRR